MKRRVVGDLPIAEMYQRSYRCKDWSKRLHVGAGIWVVVVFFTFIPLPMPFTGWPAIFFWFGVPLACLYAAFLCREQEDYYDLMIKSRIEERGKK